MTEKTVTISGSKKTYTKSKKIIKNIILKEQV